MSVTNTVFRTSKMERWAFALFMAGQAIVNTFVGSFLQLHLTNIGVTAYAVGILFLITRVWDAINDPIFGAILDKTNFPQGKFLPWIRTANFLLPLSVMLLFAVPSSLSLGMKIAWSFVAYLIFDIAYTICDVPIFAMTSAVTDQVHERTNIMARNTLLSTITIMIVSIVVPQIYPVIGAFYTSIVIAAVSALLMFFMSKFAKERYINKDNDNVTLKSMVKYVKDNKYLAIGFLGITVLSITNMTNAVTIYFAVNNLGNMGLIGTISITMVLPALLIAAFLPLLTKKIDKFNLLIFGIVGQTVMCVICYFVGYKDLTVFIVLLTLRWVFFGFQLVIQLMLTGDFVEYGEFITGKRFQGTAYSIQTLVFKFMNAVPISLAMIILGAAGFAEGTGVVQSQQVLDMIWILFILSPVAGALISLPIFAKYKLRDKNVQIMAAANSGEMSREEAEELLKGKI